jgi:hypothetical protein
MGGTPGDETGQRPQAGVYQVALIELIYPLSGRILVSALDGGQTRGCAPTVQKLIFVLQERNLVSGRRRADLPGLPQARLTPGPWKLKDDPHAAKIL